MPSATDLITYIGIPLTVLGLLPIFWNIFQSLLIRYRLAASIPWEFRHHYDLIANLANGDVIMTTRTPWCDNPGLWPESGPPKDDPTGIRFQKWRHKAWFSTALKIKKIFGIRQMQRDPVVAAEQGNRENAKLPALISREDRDFALDRTFRVDKPRLLFRQWMSMTYAIGFSLELKDEGTYEQYEHSRDTASTVNINMGIPKSQRLAMTWKNFVWFSLAIGVHPLDINLEQGAWELKCSSLPESDYRPRNKIRLSTDGGDWNVALDAHVEYDFSIRRALAWNNVMCFDRQGSTICRSLAKRIYVNPEKSEEAGNGYINANGQGQLCHDFFFELRSSYGIYPGCLGTQWKYGAAASCQIQHAAAITWLFYLEGLGELGGNDLISQGILEAQEKSLFALSRLERRGELRGKLFEMLSRPSETRSTTDPDLVDRILDFIRFEFQSSSYHDKAYEFLEALHNILRQVQESPLDAIAIAKNVRELSQSSASRTYTRSSEDPHESSARRDGKDKVISQLKIYKPFSELEEKFKLDINEHIVEKRRFPSQESELMAHVLLVLQHWQDLRRTPWNLDYTASMALIRCSLWLKRECPALDGIIHELEDVREHAKRGIFCAPGTGMVEPLLDDEKFPPVVYFV